MIVMKFGGSSLSSTASIRRVASIVRSQIDKHPVLVVSAMGDTTDDLAEVLERARRADSFLALQLQEKIKTFHFCVAEDLLGPEQLDPIDLFIRHTFRDLHVRMLEVCEGERSVTPELQDWVMSIGEQLSSKIVAAVLEAEGLPVLHLDSRELVQTDNRFTQATPLYWETYARIRWRVPLAAKDRVVVMGGYIGATENGITTTLGRGGSDLTASIVGAAINAVEIQVWKDVDGMLTWDPKIRKNAFCLKHLSYAEAAELSRAGATILHPETIAPAQRLRIPVVIRNTFRPETPGTAIGMRQEPCRHAVKSVACKTNLTVIELRSPDGGRLPVGFQELETLCREQKAAILLASDGEAIYLAVENSGKELEANILPDRCLEVRIRPRQAVLTLVGDGLTRSSVVERLAGFLGRRPALIFPQDDNACSVRIAVAEEDLSSWASILDAVFFQRLDPALFLPSAPVAEKVVPHFAFEELATVPKGFRDTRRSAAVSGHS